MGKHRWLFDRIFYLYRNSIYVNACEIDSRQPSLSYNGDALTGMGYLFESFKGYRQLSL